MSEDRAKKRLAVRWLTLAELVGILAVVIAGLGYWDAHRQRVAESQEKSAQARAGALRLSFLLTGSPETSGERLRLASVHPEQVIQTQSISFPSEIRSDPVQTTGNPRIEAGWFDGGLNRAARHRPDQPRQGRVPVGIVTVFIEDGQTKTDRSLYMLGYSSHPRMLRSDRIELEGLSLNRRGVGQDVQAAVDALWVRQAAPPT